MTSITDSQVKALHVWCRQCEKTLNDAKFYRFQSLSGRTKKWREGEFKHYIYKPFLLYYKGKSSTMDQNTCEPSDVYLALAGHIATEYSIQLPEWPSLKG